MIKKKQKKKRKSFYLFYIFLSISYFMQNIFSLSVLPDSPKVANKEMGTIFFLPPHHIETEKNLKQFHSLTSLCLSYTFIVTSIIARREKKKRKLCVEGKKEGKKNTTIISPKNNEQCLTRFLPATRLCFSECFTAVHAYLLAAFSFFTLYLRMSTVMCAVGHLSNRMCV